MQKPDKLFFSIPEELLAELRSRLSGEYPGLTFAFFEPTFKDWALWRPVGINTSTLDPTTRLIYRWAPKNHRTLLMYRPALLNPRVHAVFISGFGREVYHYAIRHSDCAESLTFHAGLVQSRIIGQGIWPPVYIDLKPTDCRVARADDRYFARSKDPKKPPQVIHYLHAANAKDRREEALAIIRPMIENLPAQRAA